mmetsp:Transcript_11971/g.30156  ORF Transcript_11971/g.30156 Transcript_11971/m.30156 type:complete len:233 (-) Transcript_11971:469-1167(-)
MCYMMLAFCSATVIMRLLRRVLQSWGEEVPLPAEPYRGALLAAVALLCPSCADVVVEHPASLALVPLQRPFRRYPLAYHTHSTSHISFARNNGCQWVPIFLVARARAALPRCHPPRRLRLTCATWLAISGRGCCILCPRLRCSGAVIIDGLVLRQAQCSIEVRLRGQRVGQVIAKAQGLQAYTRHLTKDCNIRHLLFNGAVETLAAAIAWAVPKAPCYQGRHRHLQLGLEHQ